MGPAGAELVQRVGLTEGAGATVAVIDSGVAATAIRVAVGLGASVINLSLAGANTPRLRSAVRFVQAELAVRVGEAALALASRCGGMALDEYGFPIISPQGLLPRLCGGTRAG